MVVGSRNPMLNSSFYYLSKSSSVSINQFKQSNQLFQSMAIQAGNQIQAIYHGISLSIRAVDFGQKMWQLTMLVWWHSLSGFFKDQGRSSTNYPPCNRTKCGDRSRGNACRCVSWLCPILLEPFYEMQVVRHARNSQLLFFARIAPIAARVASWEATTVRPACAEVPNMFV
mmetsp:Transcript_13977/g.23396  ORF Transcript_13977/g.23396 Transcript_13977/m.23396 type:complete len:171 (+) Transcript_13977:57-569(+)